MQLAIKPGLFFNFVNDDMGFSLHLKRENVPIRRQAP